MTIDAVAAECGHLSTCDAINERIKNNPWPRNSSSSPTPVARSGFESPWPGYLLIPVDPFGGFGDGDSVLFWGKDLSRDRVIAKIVTFVMGVEYSHRKISSHRQRIIKGLLDRYISDTVEPFIRGYAGAALRRFAGTIRLCDYFGSYIDNTPASPPEKSQGVFLAQVFAVQQLLMDHPDPPPPASYHQDVGTLALHPFLAFFLGINGTDHETTHFASYFACTTVPSRVIPDLGQNWWDYYVMTETERKHEYTVLWLDMVRGQDMHDISFYRKVGPPPASDGGPFWGRYTPFTHLHREDCGHPTLYESPTVFHGRPDACSTIVDLTGQSP
ncbi:hypothetical protein QFC21_003197 [Naganishia friedmannii]|uniref:Uncharacterized protein n=1 Tax=Naganishia friedmannii TaxID=89922 RepID=A0ACC2VRA3_9TREE|nr:hypothetical protein QFC21_003197 [Naganishia friedmannii]